MLLIKDQQAVIIAQVMHPELVLGLIASVPGVALLLVFISDLFLAVAIWKERTFSVLTTPSQSNVSNTKRNRLCNGTRLTVARCKSALKHDNRLKNERWLPQFYEHEAHAHNVVTGLIEELKNHTLLDKYYQQRPDSLSVLETNFAKVTKQCPGSRDLVYVEKKNDM